MRDGDDWVINGRKIWISRAADADFTILMAVTDKEKRARGGISAFLVDKGTPGFNVLRRIPMIGGAVTYEIALEDCRVEGWKLLGTEGKGFAPMQLRLGTRRIQMAAWSVGMAQRALDMICEYAPQRVTFGQPLSERQAIQWWVADAATKIHAARLMTYDCAWKLDQGRDVRLEISMIKAFATEMAYEVVDHAMQTFGAMGMTKELPLQLMAPSCAPCASTTAPPRCTNGWWPATSWGRGDEAIAPLHHASRAPPARSAAMMEGRGANPLLTVGRRRGRARHAVTPSDGGSQGRRTM